jgi:hypothetical protein
MAHRGLAHEQRVVYERVLVARQVRRRVAAAHVQVGGHLAVVQVQSAIATLPPGLGKEQGRVDRQRGRTGTTLRCSEDDHPPGRSGRVSLADEPGRSASADAASAREQGIDERLELAVVEGVVRTSSAPASSSRIRSSRPGQRCRRRR